MPARMRSDDVRLCCALRRARRYYVDIRATINWFEQASRPGVSVKSGARHNSRVKEEGGPWGDKSGSEGRGKENEVARDL